MKQTPITRKTPLKRGGRLKPVNRERRASAFARNFGERGALVREMTCIAAQPRPWGCPPAWVCCSGTVEAAHVRSRGAGGNRRHLVPLCTRHHWQQHHEGIQTFAKIYALDLPAAAQRIAAELDERGVP